MNMQRADCSFCNGPRSSIHLKYPCGTRIVKFFPKSINNAQEGWYAGTIRNHFLPDEIHTVLKQHQGQEVSMWNLIVFEDGDVETLSNEKMNNDSSLKILSIASLQENDTHEPETKSANGTIYRSKKIKIGPVETVPLKAPKKARTQTKKANKDSQPTLKAEEGSPEPVYSFRNPPPRSACIVVKTKSFVKTENACDPETVVVTPRSSNPPSPETVPSSTATNSNRTAEDDPPQNTSDLADPPVPREEHHVRADHVTSTAVPDAPCSSSAQILGEVFATVNQDCKVKEEGTATSLTPWERRKREAAFRYWVHQNTDPVTEEGRYVFRRSCHRDGTICTVLKGAGMDPWPIVKNPPRLYADDQINPFIRPGEFYVAGNEAWNPFGPRFPGDKGLVNSMAFEGCLDQKEFHLFVECADKPHKRHWHGKLAAGGRMYCGVYRVPDEDDPFMSIEFAKPEHISLENKLAIAEYFLRRHAKENGPGNFRKEMAKNVEEQAKQLADGDWDALSEEKKDSLAMVAHLIVTNFTMETAPVEFVRFDEELYQCLVKYDCAVTRGKVRGRVELEAAVLHQYF